MMSNVKTHDYTKREWGHDYNVTSVDEQTHDARLIGWGVGITEGDYILLKSGEGSTRYRIIEINYFSDPYDMWSAETSFAPRDSV